MQGSLINKVRVIVRAQMVSLESYMFFSCLDMPPSQEQTFSGLTWHKILGHKIQYFMEKRGSLPEASSNSASYEEVRT